MLLMNVAGVPGKSFTIGVGVPRIPCTRPAVSSTPDPTCSPHANNTRYSTCSPAIATSPSKSPGAPTRTLSTPTVRPTRGWQGPDASRDQHTDLHARTEGPNRAHNAGQDTQTLSRGHPGLLRPPPLPPKRSTAASNTYVDPHSDSETSPTTSPEHSSKQEDSDPNYTPNYEELGNLQTRRRLAGFQPIPVCHSVRQRPRQHQWHSDLPFL